METPLQLRNVLSLELPALEIMDIGAMVNGANRYDTLVGQGIGKVTGFEPNPSEFEKLPADPDSTHRYYPYFLGDGKKHTFHLTRYPGCSSLLEPDPAVIDLFSTIGTEPGAGNFSVLETQTVETTRLDDIEGLPKPDFVKLDIQGAELMVMKNGEDILSRALILETEVEFIPLYKGQPLFGDIQMYLHQQGFILHKMIDIAGRPLRPIAGPNPYKAISQLLWADAVFIRDFIDLSNFTNQELLQAALILNDVYKSYDMALHLLSEHDRRQQGTLAGVYMQTLKETGQLELMYMNLMDHS